MTVTVQWYNHLLESMSDGSMDMDTNTFKMMLLNNSHAFNAAHTSYADVSANEIANGDGYTTGGVALTNVTWAQTSGVIKFDADDPSWTASGSGITAYHAVLYDDTSASNLLLCSINFGGVVSASAGATLNIIIPSTGIFTGAFA